MGIDRADFGDAVHEQPVVFAAVRFAFEGGRERSTCRC
jgi:hypothetical protein